MNLLQKRTWIVLCIVWLVVQLFWLFKFGIYREEEAVVYINIASRIAQGDWNHSIHYWLYAGYISPLVFLKFIGLAFEWMYLVQLTLSFVAFVCFIRLLGLLKISVSAIVIGSLLYATSPIIQAWNSHLYTDGYFGSLVVIALYFISRNPGANFAAFFRLMLLLLFVCFTRPVGFLLIPVAIVYGYTSKVSRRRIYVMASMLLAFSIFVLYALRHGNDFFYPKHNLDLNIICGLPSELKQYETVPNDGKMSIITYFFSNPGLTVRLFFSRLIKSVWMTRPYFSTMHNMVIGVTCSIYYFLALLGTVYAFRKKILNNLYIFFGMGIWLIPNILLCADWHNRFMIPFTAFLLVVATLGIEFLLKRTGLQREATK